MTRSWLPASAACGLNNSVDSTIRGPVLRPQFSGKFELFMTRRPSEMEFLGGFYVFPGEPAYLDLASDPGQF